MAASVTVQLTDWLRGLSSKLVRAEVRLHNACVIDPDMAVIFAANHFTRIETLLLPCILQEHMGLLPRALVPAALFRGRVGKYLKASGTVSADEVNEDTTVVRTLLRGEHPWLVFTDHPAHRNGKRGQDNTLGSFPLQAGGLPHEEAAALAIRAAYCRARFRAPQRRESQEEVTRTLQRFGLENTEAVEARRTVIIPLNITYYPIRLRDNLFIRAAEHLGRHANAQTLSEISVQGSVLDETIEIDISFGEPLDIGAFLNRPEHAPVMACTFHAAAESESDPDGPFQHAARALAREIRDAIRDGVTVNLDHLFAGLVLEQPEGRLFKERDYRERLFLCCLQAQKKERRLHPDLKAQCLALLHDEELPAFRELLRIAVEKKYMLASEWGYRVSPERLRPLPGSLMTAAGAARDTVLREFEAAHVRSTLCRYTAWAPDFVVKAYLRRYLVRQDLRNFEKDYACFYQPRDCKPPEVGRPFLLCPWRIRGGVVLAHGYMAAPMEVRALAEHLRRRGFAVYGVRLQGHGTAPEDLAQQQWEDWYASVVRGYAIMRTLTDNIVIGGFSTGGCLALLAAARKKKCFNGVFSICAPLYVRNYSIRLVPSIISMNALLKRFGQSHYARDFVENDPENKHINYTRNPLTGVRQLTAIMHATAGALPDIGIPALVIQASQDPTVDPSSGPDIFAHLGTRQKQYSLFERDRHGIINGEGSPEIFAQVEQFLLRTAREVSSQKYWLFGRRLGQTLSHLFVHRHRTSQGSEGGSAAEDLEIKTNNY